MQAKKSSRGTDYRFFAGFFTGFFFAGFFFAGLRLAGFRFAPPTVDIVYKGTQNEKKIQIPYI